jgi:hypothetical protein
MAAEPIDNQRSELPVLSSSSNAGQSATLRACEDFSAVWKIIDDENLW